jgi:RNA polymerase sigma-70 factor, ECF subfamily
VTASETIRRAQAGDQAAFRQLYDEQASRVYAVCLRLTGNRAEAEERTQDAFVRAWEKLDSFRGDSAFSTWLYRLTVNVVFETQRASGRREARVGLADDPADLEQAASAAPAAPGLARDLEQAVAALPEGARQVFVLHEVDGYQHDEIALMLGIAEGTSKAQLHRARRLLREALDR